MLTKKRTQLKSFYGTQQLEQEEGKEDFWYFENEDMKNQFEILIKDAQRNKTKIFEIIASRFFNDLKSSNHGNIEKIAFVLHDKDKDDSGSFIKPHIHWLLELKQKRDLEEVAYRFFVKPQQIEKGSQGKNGLIGRIGYLIHLAEPDKYKYKIEDIETFGTFDYKAYIEKNELYFKKRLAQNRKKQAKNDVDYYLQQVQYGQLFLEDMLSDTNLFTIYANNKQKFKDAFESYNELNSFRTINARKAKEFDFTTIYIYGKSGLGKTTIAMEIIEQLKSFAHDDGLRWRSYSGSAKNAVDDYKAQELILFDDLKQDSFLISDWLKILDSRNESTISGRFHNRPLSARLIILTTIENPFSYFDFGRDEPKEQFIRRLSYVIDVSSFSNFDEEMKNTIFSIKKPNRENSYWLKEEYKEVGMNSLLHSDWLKNVYKKIKGVD
ncbi:Rep family protein [Carnobacterium divergens]|uniref:Rep family protein n=1 Tax=Carnobacterium divergens TaxID=2748 RepID=UPI0030556CF3